MSLLLDYDRGREVVWDQANVTMTIVPLTSENDIAFTKQTTREILAGNQFKRTEQDVNEYMRLIGLHCIKGWTGMYLDKDTEAKCTAENIEKAMKHEAVQNFLINKVLDVNVLLTDEVVKAKKE